MSDVIAAGAPLGADLGVWLVLAGCAGVTYLYRILPALVPAIRYADSESRLLRFFDYASYAVIGGIVSSNLLSGVGLPTGPDLSVSILGDVRFWVGVAAVGTSFSVAAATGRQISAIAGGLAVYQGLVLVI